MLCAVGSNSAIALSVAGIVSLADLPLFAQPGGALPEGKAAFGDWRADKPGTRRLIKPRDLPAAAELPSAHNFVRVTHRGDQKPVVPPGFEVNLFASGLAGPRTLRTAPNGDIFVAESGAGRIRVLRPKGGEACEIAVATGEAKHGVGIADIDPLRIGSGRIEGDAERIVHPRGKDRRLSLLDQRARRARR